MNRVGWVVGYFFVANPLSNQLYGTAAHKVSYLHLKSVTLWRR